jgi:hypothetical protein
MPAGYPAWPGPRDAEEGEAYTRADPDGDGNVFVVSEISDETDGGITVVGHYEVID